MKGLVQIFQNDFFKGWISGIPIYMTDTHFGQLEKLKQMRIIQYRSDPLLTSLDKSVLKNITGLHIANSFTEIKFEFLFNHNCFKKMIQQFTHFPFLLKFEMGE
jgi:hypothetical protein